MRQLRQSGYFWNRIVAFGGASVFDALPLVCLYNLTRNPEFVAFANGFFLVKLNVRHKRRPSASKACRRVSTQWSAAAPLLDNVGSTILAESQAIHSITIPLNVSLAFTILQDVSNVSLPLW